MRLLIKQRVFSWTDTYDVYDENEQNKYFVKTEFLSIGHKIHVYDMYHNEVGFIREKVIALLPSFEVEIAHRYMGKINKKLTFFKPRDEIDYNGWTVEGDIMGWNYNVYSGYNPVVHIKKELLRWGDTYVIDISQPKDEIAALMLVLAIDAANCQNDN